MPLVRLRDLDDPTESRDAILTNPVSQYLFPMKTPCKYVNTPYGVKVQTSIVRTLCLIHRNLHRVLHCQISLFAPDC